ncbi:hypothetical protein DM01DRAFT_1336556 [Hesseltinella vesiculosa]|uniref:PX domain-containing protein n=1 Tax=Hesseltinella vesiculosa TaxID=101127 RepID=A0A1X2GFX3_9FUNG|nr:hypothetical protein DM01DRAFT_1336556 [Hesseltinella vesiculosa]
MFKKASLDGVKLAPPIRKLSVLTFECDDDQTVWYIIKVTPEPLGGQDFVRQRKTYLIARRFEEFLTLDQQLRSLYSPSMSSTLMTALRKSRANHHLGLTLTDEVVDESLAKPLPRLKRQRSKKKEPRQRQTELQQYCQALLDQPTVKQSKWVLEFFGQHKTDTERLVYSVYTHAAGSGVMSSTASFASVTPVAGPTPTSTPVDPPVFDLANVTQAGTTAPTLLSKNDRRQKKVKSLSSATTVLMDHTFPRLSCEKPAARSIFRAASQPDLHRPHRRRSKSPSTLLRSLARQTDQPPLPPLPPLSPTSPVLSVSSSKGSSSSSSSSICLEPAPLAAEKHLVSPTTPWPQPLPTVDKLVSPSFWNLALEGSSQDWKTRPSDGPPGSAHGQDSADWPHAPLKLKVVYDLDNIVLLQVPRTIRLPELRARILHKFGGMASDLPVDFKLVFFNPAQQHVAHSSSAAYSTYAHLDNRTIIRTQDDLMHAMHQWHGLSKISVRCVVN